VIVEKFAFYGLLPCFGIIKKAVDAASLKDSIIAKELIINPRLKNGFTQFGKA
jgi:hypothetical protein